MYKKYLLSIILVMLFVPFVVAETNSTQVANCTEQLGILLNEYNSLLSEFKNGTNCGGFAFQMVKEFNEELVLERDALKLKLKNSESYKLCSFILFGLVIILSVVLIFSKNKSKK